MYNLSPSPLQQFIGTDGKPLAGYLIYTYESGTTPERPKPTYKDYSGTPNENPIELDISGSARILLEPGAYSYKLATPLGVEVWTEDNIDASRSFFYGDPVSIADHGCIGDSGVTDNGPLIAAVIAANPGKELYVPMDASGGNYGVSTNLTIPSSVTVRYETGARIYATGTGTFIDQSHSISFGSGANAVDNIDDAVDGLRVVINSTPDYDPALFNGHNYNLISIKDDHADGEGGALGSKVNLLRLEHLFGGPGTTGGRHVIAAKLEQQAVADAGSLERNYVAVVGQTISATGDGGSAGDEKGNYFAFNPFIQLKAGAMHTSACIGAEVDVAVDTGASTLRRVGWSLCSRGNVQGTTEDAALGISGSGSATGTTGWKTGIHVSNHTGGGEGISAGGTILFCDQPQSLGNVIVVNSPVGGSLLEYDKGTGGDKVIIDTVGIVHEHESSAVKLGSPTILNFPGVWFKSSGNDIAYDSRITGSGGTTTTGEGALNLSAKSCVFNGGLTGGIVRPGVDNNSVLGTASFRWDVVYAGTGTINTSDAREKTLVIPLTAAELSAAKAMAGEVGTYKFLSSVDSKGDAARSHVGMTVQRAIEIMESFGLIPTNYGFICYDEWVAKDEVFDNDGVMIEPAMAAGNRYAFRYNELHAFILRGLLENQNNIESRITTLEGAV